MRTVLITLIGPERTSDLVVDAELPLSELLPSLLAAGGVHDAPGEWGLAVMGRQPIAPERTLEQAEVLDGAVLVLRRERPAATDPRPASGLPRGPGGSPLARARERLGGEAELESRIREVRLARCPTVAIASPKGGVGKTTVSIMLGELFSRLREDEVIALDADSDYGSLARVAPVPSGPGEAGRDAGIFQSLDEGAVTFAELDRTLWMLPGGLRIVPSPRDPAAMARTDRTAYARVLGSLQRLAGVLVVDCGTGLGQPGVQAAILACDQLVLVTDATGATASLAAEAYSLLERAGRPITVVCNRLRRGRPGLDDLARIDALFPRASALVGIPDDPAAELALRGELGLERAPKPLYDGVRELAGVLALAWPELGLGPAAHR